MNLYLALCFFYTVNAHEYSIVSSNDTVITACNSTWCSRFNMNFVTPYKSWDTLIDGASWIWNLNNNYLHGSSVGFLYIELGYITLKENSVITFATLNDLRDMYIFIGTYSITNLGNRASITPIDISKDFVKNKPTRVYLKAYNSQYSNYYSSLMYKLTVTYNELLQCPAGSELTRFTCEYQVEDGSIKTIQNLYPERKDSTAIDYSMIIIYSVLSIL